MKADEQLLGIPPAEKEYIGAAHIRSQGETFHNPVQQGHIALGQLGGVFNAGVHRSLRRLPIEKPMAGAIGFVTSGVVAV